MSRRFLWITTVSAFVLITALNLSIRGLRDAYVTVYVATGHLITPTLLVGGLFFAVTLIWLVRVGGIRPGELGWRRADIAPALALAGGVWVAFQLVELVAALACGAGIALSPAWTGGAWATAVGTLAGMLLGVAAGEETFFRGFLLPQAWKNLGQRTTAGSLGLAVVTSQLIFALYHLPNLVLGVSGQVAVAAGEILVQVALDALIGVVFAGVYLRTGNLFMVIALHALQNAGTSLVATPIDPGLVIFVLAILILAGMFRPTRRRGPRSPERLPGELGERDDVVEVVAGAAVEGAPARDEPEHGTSRHARR